MKENERAKQMVGQDVGRRDMQIPEFDKDPYKLRTKAQGPLECPDCFAVYDEGRWMWTETPPKGAERELCPACHRTNDRYPAGEIHIGGAFALAHKDDILGLMHNCQTRESKEHPLSRIIAIQEGEKEILVTTTDLHLPHVIANALERAYKSQADIHFDRQGYFVRVRWNREK